MYRNRLKEKLGDRKFSWFSPSAISVVVILGAGITFYNRKIIVCHVLLQEKTQTLF